MKKNGLLNQYESARNAKEAKRKTLQARKEHNRKLSGLDRENSTS